jgi:hypothetical protein
MGRRAYGRYRREPAASDHEAAHSSKNSGDEAFLAVIDRERPSSPGPIVIDADVFRGDLMIDDLSGGSPGALPDRYSPARSTHPASWLKHRPSQKAAWLPA